MNTKINLENFMIQARQEANMNFDTFHAAFEIVNGRRNRALYSEIKNGEITVNQLVVLLKKFGA